MFTEKLNQSFPSGFHIPAMDLEADTLHTLIRYPATRIIKGTFTRQEQPDVQEPEYLQAELRIAPKDYPLLEPFAEEFLSPSVTEQFFSRYPDFFGGTVEADLRDTHKLMECLYVENVPMSKVTDILLHHRDMRTRELKETLQLFDLMERGVEVLESGKTLMPAVAEKVGEVTRDFQHMYTGEDKPLDTHQYYRNDIRPKYNGELKKMAELKLRERKMIQTRPQSFTVTWSNANGDGWECREMADIINRNFQDYRGMLARATQSQAGPDSPVMQLDVLVTKPRWRKEVLDTVQKSWALVGMTEITDREELPLEIATWHRQNDAERLLCTRFAGVNDAMYVFETRSDGFALVGRDRTVRHYGEEFSPQNKEAFERLVKHENVMTLDGSLFMRPAGPERVFLEKATGKKLNVYQETVGDRKMLVLPYKLKPSRVQDNPEDFVEITGRISDAKIIGKGYSTSVRCKIDGEQYPAARLVFQDVIRYENGNFTPEQLAVKYFTAELLQSQERGQQQDKGIHR